MTLFKNKYRIESNRLKNWDYSSNAIYFLTICCNQRACIFGTVEKDEMVLNENGAIIEDEIFNSMKIRQNWIFHNWEVMPNHIHLLIEINNPVISKFSYSARTILPDDTAIELRNLCVSQNAEAHSNASLSKTSNVSTNENQNTAKELSRKPRSISSFVGGLKGTVTVKISELNNQFEGSIWQSNFHDHVVRSYEEFKAIYYYIENNPKNWTKDIFNPINAKK